MVFSESRRDEIGIIRVYKVQMAVCENEGMETKNTCSKRTIFHQRLT